MVKIEEGQAHATLTQPKEFFSSFLLSVDGIMGREAQVVLATLSWLMAAKMDESILHVNGWVNGRIAI